MRTKLLAVLAVLVLSGCETVPEGHVGVWSNWGKINKVEQGAGFVMYNPIASDIDVYSVQEIPVELDNLTPKAGDNLSLTDFDVTVYYTPNRDEVAEIVSQYASSTGYLGDQAYPAYQLVYKMARDAVYETIGKQPNSLSVNTARAEIKSDIMDALKIVETKGWGRVNRVIIRSIKTDVSIENSIRSAVDAKNKLIAMDSRVDIAKKEAEIKIVEAKGIAKSNEIINDSLTAEYLQHEQNMAIKAGLSKGANTVVIPANMNGMMINIQTK